MKMYTNVSMFSGNGNYTRYHPNQEIYQYVFLQPDAFSTSEIRSIGKFEMTRPLYLETYYDEEGFYHIDYESADIFSVGATIEEAKDDFLNELQSAWKSYVLSDPDDFHESALKYRKWLMDNIIGPEK